MDTSKLATTVKVDFLTSEEVLALLRDLQQQLAVVQDLDRRLTALEQAGRMPASVYLDAHYQPPPAS